MTTPKIVAPKKLIQVALPLDEINKACAREKSIRHGHPSTLHLWWARRPLAAARAVLFAQLVNDPSWKFSDDDLKKPQVKSAITRKRNELFKLINELVQWENTTNDDVLSRARLEIRASWKETCEANRSHPDAKSLFDAGRLPAFHDPFAGGGAIPLEAQRLGLASHASDLNPVAVLINKAMIEIPSRFGSRPPVGPIPSDEKQTSAAQTEKWVGARGLAEDVRRYVTWMRQQAHAAIGELYPDVLVTPAITRERPDLKKYEGRTLRVIAWLWARTVASPNPALGGKHVPLVTSWWLARKNGKEAWVSPRVAKGAYRFEVHVRSPDRAPAKDVDLGTKLGRSDFKCLLSESAITGAYIKSEGRSGRLSARLLAVVLEGDRERVYLAPRPQDEAAAERARPDWRPSGAIPERLTGGTCFGYGLTSWDKLFTPRQLVALSTFTDLVENVRVKATRDATKNGIESTDTRRLDDGGLGAVAYGDAMAVFAAISVSRLVDRNNTLCTWNAGPSGSKASTGASATTPSIRAAFARQAIPMTWDFAEASPFSESGGGLESALRWIVPAVAALPAGGIGTAALSDVRAAGPAETIVSTDPPYFDNISYAELSDFFYVWLRRSLKTTLPSLCGTLLTPKEEELVANQFRHGGHSNAEAYFLRGMSEALAAIADRAHPAYPISVYYAFKQSDTDDDTGTASAGWETFLTACLGAGMSIMGTWPIRTERGARPVGAGANALASSIVLVLSPRHTDAKTVPRREFLRSLESVLPGALAEMTSDPFAAIAPVDLAQAAIGPGMAVFSRYGAVLEADGSSMPVRSALVHINKAIDAYFAHAEGELDADTRFCIGWFEQFGFEAGEFGQADVLARAKGTSVEGVKEAGVVEAGRGKVRLFAIKELPKKWDPTTDTRTPIWEALHHMCRALGESEGEAGALLAKMPEKQDAIRQLAYRLYTLCAERKGKAELGRPYNDLITSWPAIVEASEKVGHVGTQLALL